MRKVDCLQLLFDEEEDEEDDAAVVGTVSAAMGPPCGHPATCVTLLACTHCRRSRADMGAGAEVAWG